MQVAKPILLFKFDVSHYYWWV